MSLSSDFFFFFFFFFCSRLNGFKYCANSHNLTSVICLHTKFLGNFIYLNVRNNLFASNIAIVSIQLTGFNYCYLTQIILFNINPLFADSELIISIVI